MKKVTREEAKASKYYEAFVAFNMPLAFIAAELEDYDATWLDQGDFSAQNQSNFALYLDYVSTIGDKIERGLGLFLAGSFGVGKTMLEVIALKKTIDFFTSRPPQFVDECFRMDYLTGEGLVGLFSYDGDDNNLNRRLALKTVDVLAIDELTRVPLTASAKEKVLVEGVIRSRAFDLKPTIITSQSSAEELGGDMNQALPELLREYFVVCTFVAPSWRGHYEEKKG